MEGINIPMRTKPSMDLRTSFQGNGEERIRPALDLREVQAGLLQRAQREVTGSMPQGSMQGENVQRDRAGSMPNGRAGGTRQGGQTVRTPQSAGRAAGISTVRHYEVQPEGGAVLNKGGKVSFRSLFPGNLSKIEVVMGWDAPRFSFDDVDASCYLLGENGKVVGDDWFVFYNQPSSPDGAVRHQGKGNGIKKEEIITVDFGRLRPEIKRLAFVLTINEAQERGYSFSQVGNAHIRIRDGISRKELAVFNLSDYYDGVTAMTVCEFYDYHGEWKINPVGHGLKNTGLLELCQFYGVRVE